MKKRISAVLALALVFVLAFSNVAFAASYAVISNTLIANIKVAQPKTQLDLINEASTPALMMTALEMTGGLELKEYGNPEIFPVNGGRRVATANYVRFVREATSAYTNLAAVQSAFNAGLVDELNKKELIDLAAKTPSIGELTAALAARASLDDTFLKTYKSETALAAMNTVYGAGLVNTLEDRKDTIAHFIALTDGDKATVANEYHNRQVVGGSFVKAMENLTAAVDAMKGVAALDFSVFEAIKGYNVGFDLVNAVPSDVESIDIEIFQGTTSLMKNTATGLMTKWPDLDNWSTPFAVFSTFGYEADGNWSTTGWSSAVSELVVPDKAIVTVKFKNVATPKTAVHTELSGDPTVIMSEAIDLVWVNSDETTTSEPITVNVPADGTATLKVRATSPYLLNNVRYVIEIVTGAAGVTGISGTTEDADGYYVTEASSFERATGDETREMTFTVTAESGTYVLHIYAVK